LIARGYYRNSAGVDIAIGTTIVSDIYIATIRVNSNPFWVSTYRYCCNNLVSRPRYYRDGIEIRAAGLVTITSSFAGLKAIPSGATPTGIVAITWLLGDIIETVLEPRLTTYTSLSVESIASPYGTEPAGIVAITWLLGDIIETVSEAELATYTLPVTGLTAILNGS
jgi:hypothetical protein